MPALGNTIAQLRSLLAEAAHQLYRRGFVSGIAGNLSARVRADLVLIKPTGFCLGTISPDAFVEVNLEGNVLKGAKPSRELMLHLSIYRARPDARAIIHTHQPYGTALANDEEAARAVERRIGPLAIVDYAPPGSLKLAELTAHALSQSGAKVALLRGHGVVAVGESVQEALSQVYKLEEAAKCVLRVGAS